MVDTLDPYAPASSGGPMAPPSVPSVPSVPSTPTSTNPMLDAYRNPYTKNVIDTTVGQIEKSGQQRRNQLGTEAFSAGAYGDARHGVEGAGLTKDLEKTIADYTGAANAQGFESSMGWMNQDIDRQVNTEFNNAQLDNQWLSEQLQLLGLGDQFGNESLSNAEGYADSLLGLDQYDMGQQQQDLNVQYEDYLRAQGYDSEQINQMVSWLSGVPGQVGSSSSTPDNSWASMFGAGLSGIKDTSGNRLFS